MEQVRAVDQQAPGGGERVRGRAWWHRRHRTRRRAPGYDRAMGLLLLVDLDGVVYRGADPVPGVAAVLADRAARGDDVVYVTNNSMHYRADYQTRLAAMGAPVSPDTVVSSARATALYLRDHDPAIRRVLVLGGSGLERELRDVGLRRGDVGRGRDPDEPGADRRLRRRRQPRRGRRRARPEPDLCAAGGRLGLHPGRRPLHRHQPRPGLPDGARAAAGCRLARHRCSRPRPASSPVSIGKPAPYLLEAAAHAVGREPAEAIMIGDGIADRPRRGPCRRRPLRPDADRRDDPGRGRGPARRRAARPPSPPTPPSWPRSWTRLAAG